MSEIDNFIKLLNYFVAHLEYCNAAANKLDSVQSYVETLKNVYGIDVNNKEKFKSTGQGYKGQKIQKQIKQWSSYDCGRICISCQNSQGGGYTSEANYLHWYGTGLDICADWDNNKIKINSLYIIDKDLNNIKSFSIQINDLKTDNNKVNEFLNWFKEALDYHRKEITKTKYLPILFNNYNLVLTGAPGTGKTYLAREIAAAMIGCDKNELNNNDRFGFVQFHPSYDYTDFVEGLRPKDDGTGNIKFERKDGIFKAFCANAAIAENEDAEKVIKQEIKEEEKRKFVFVIDEINRGEISKIFGELFFSIDPGYREKKDRVPVRTQYQNLIHKGERVLNEDGKDLGEYHFVGGFYVPSNIYIIGTMNDIDRSVESMDFAFRRRFAFAEVTAADSSNMIFTNKEIADSQTKTDLVERMIRLNNMLMSDEVGLPEAYQIGGAYFIKYIKCNQSNGYEELWDYYLRGTLYEYFRGLPTEEIQAKMELLKKAYDGK